jgi:hypothetical protein
MLDVERQAAKRRPCRFPLRSDPVRA